MTKELEKMIGSTAFLIDLMWKIFVIRINRFNFQFTSCSNYCIFLKYGKRSMSTGRERDRVRERGRGRSMKLLIAFDSVDSQ